MNELVKRVKGIKPGKLLTAGKSGLSSAITYYNASKDMGVQRTAELDAIMVLGGAIGAATTAIQNDMPWSFTAETGKGHVGHFEIRGQQGVALNLHYIGHESHTLRWMKIPGHTKGKKIAIMTTDTPVDRCSSHPMSIAEIAVIYLVMGGLKKGDKLAEHVASGKWNVLHFSDVHKKAHETMDLDGAYAYCNNIVWAAINSKYETNKVSKQRTS